MIVTVHVQCMLYFVRCYLYPSLLYYLQRHQEVLELFIKTLVHAYLKSQTCVWTFWLLAGFLVFTEARLMFELFLAVATL